MNVSLPRSAEREAWFESELDIERVRFAKTGQVVGPEVVKELRYVLNCPRPYVDRVIRTEEALRESARVREIRRQGGTA